MTPPIKENSISKECKDGVKGCTMEINHVHPSPKIAEVSVSQVPFLGKAKPIPKDWVVHPVSVVGVAKWEKEFLQEFSFEDWDSRIAVMFDLRDIKSFITNLLSQTKQETKAEIIEMIEGRAKRHHKDCLNDMFINGRFWEAKDITRIIKE